MNLFDHPLLGMALLAGITSAFASGIMGSYVVIRRILSMTGSISHSVLGGMGLFLWLNQTYGIEWLTPIGGAFFAAMLSAILIAFVHLNYRERIDTVIAMIWSAGMAIGVLFLSLSSGYNGDLLDYLFGNILWVGASDIQLLLLLNGAVAILIYFYHSRFVAICFDEDQARLQNVPVKALFTLLLCLIALSIVLLIQIVGAILAIAMLSIPAALAGSFTNRLPIMMTLAVFFGVLFNSLGTFVAFQLDWPLGATITLCAITLYTLRLLFSVKKGPTAPQKNESTQIS